MNWPKLFQGILQESLRSSNQMMLLLEHTLCSSFKIIESVGRKKDNIEKDSSPCVGSWLYLPLHTMQPLKYHPFQTFIYEQIIAFVKNVSNWSQ